MNRFEELFITLEQQYENDWWLKAYEELFDDTSFNPQINAYTEAISVLNHDSWEKLKSKVIKLFRQNTLNRGKSQFFSQLNEAFAYKYLLESGFYDVDFIKESRIKTPDLSYKGESFSGLCEVKTIHISLEEIIRTNLAQSFENSVYEFLSEGFFNKLKFDLDNSVEKMIINEKEKMLIYIIIFFDDFMLFYFENYKKQILEFIKKYYPTREIYFQVGIGTDKFIHYLPS
jgi:hypothetical protein